MHLTVPLPRSEGFDIRIFLANSVGNGKVIVLRYRAVVRPVAHRVVHIGSEEGDVKGPRFTSSHQDGSPEIGQASAATLAHWVLDNTALDLFPLALVNLCRQECAWFRVDLDIFLNGGVDMGSKAGNTYILSALYVEHKTCRTQAIIEAVAR